ncbi:MAG: glycosyl hydrolase [Luteolibacter sp.]
MFSETEGSRKAIGDIHVFFHEGLYHLFHLVLPNHDFIAHAVSTDAIHWRRVGNALFLGDPGDWDDLMLWTMHVTPDPHKPGGWRMFYTGLSRRERGLYQRVGLATSDDLYVWKKRPVSWVDGRGPKDPELVLEARKKSMRGEAGEISSPFDEESCYPIGPSAEYYESDLDEGRQFISFRDPFFFEDEGRGILLVAARVKEGPVVRRGCVAKYVETSPYHFEAEPALLHPGLYDDVEVPNIVKIEGERYLIGSMREDAKIRYWKSTGECSDWRSYHDNVLMPQGNYAGRVCDDGNGWMLWCFYAMNQDDRTANNMMPPPKRLRQADDGSLYLETYEGFEQWMKDAVELNEPTFLLPENHGHEVLKTENGWNMKSDFSYQAFLLDGPLWDFRLDCKIAIDGKGKCGFVFRLDEESHDGYYLSLDLLKGLAQLRSWGTSDTQIGENMMQFKTLQSGNWVARGACGEEFSLLAFGSYIELSVGGKIILSLADLDFKEGRVGVYADSCSLSLENVKLRPMRKPAQRDGQLVGG